MADKKETGMVLVNVDQAKMEKKQHETVEANKELKKNQKLPIGARVAITTVVAGAAGYADGFRSDDGKGDTVKVAGAAVTGGLAVIANMTNHPIIQAGLEDATLALIAAETAMSAQQAGFEAKLEAAKKKPHNPPAKPQPPTNPQPVANAPANSDPGGNTNQHKG